MAMKVNGATYYLADDCDTLVCKLDNAAYEAFMNSDYDRATRLENDRDELEIAIQRGDRETMQAMLDKYSTWFKRYR